MSLFRGWFDLQATATQATSQGRLLQLLLLQVEVVAVQLLLQQVEVAVQLLLLHLVVEVTTTDEVMLKYRPFCIPFGVSQQQACKQ